MMVKGEGREPWLGRKLGAQAYEPDRPGLVFQNIPELILDK